MNVVLHYCRLLTRYYAPDFDDSVLFMNECLTNNVSHETPFRPDDPLITNKEDAKWYIHAHLDTVKLSRYK